MTTVLVVEDEALIADDLQRTLVRMGYRVPTVVASGEEALRAVAAERPELVLMDIKLQGAIDGIEAASRIRSESAVPILYLTSHSGDATLARAKTTRPHGYLLKPFGDRELGIAIDLALHNHRVEAELAARERWFATTLNSISDAVIAANPAGVVTFLNASAERLTAWSRGEAIGFPLERVVQLVDGAGKPTGSPLSAPRAPSGVAQTGSGLLVARGGARVEVEHAAAPIVDDRGAVLGGVVVLRDVSEKRKLESRLAHSQRLSSLGTMAAGIAHEINNPLAYVVANVQMSVEGLARLDAELRAAPTAPANPKDGERLLDQVGELAAALRDAGEGADRVRAIVGQLMKVAGRRDERREVVEVVPALESALQMTHHVVRHRARVVRAFAATPRVAADPGQLAQVFTNLLINAAQAIGDGRADEHAVVVRAFTDAQGQAVVEVEDDGPGIAPELLPRIFDPFFTTKPVGSGMGLGLSLSFRIVQSCGGTLEAENVPGGGARFRVALPPAAEARAEVLPPPAHRTATRRARVLVIDDEPMVATVLRRILRDHHDVTTASEGKEAVALLTRGERFDVIFCDVMMPNWTGLDVHQAVRRIDPAQADRIIFMTGGAFSAVAARGLRELPNRTLGKPFDTQRPLALIAELLAEAPRAG